MDFGKNAYFLIFTILTKKLEINHRIKFAKSDFCKAFENNKRSFSFSKGTYGNILFFYLMRF